MGIDKRLLQFVVAASALSFGVAPAEAQGQAEAAGPRKCYPHFDPNTGVPYPACPRPNMTKYERELLDITKDTYERALRSARRDDRISEEQFRAGSERVRQARDDIRSSRRGDF